MKNNFKENLHQKIIDDISYSAVSELQNQLSVEAAQSSANIYDAVKSLEKEHLKFSPSRKAASGNRNQFDYGLALNVFMQKFILENKNEIDNMRIQYIEKQRLELEIIETGNPKYFLANDNSYYTFEYDKFIKQPQVLNISYDGEITTKEKIAGTDYYSIKQYTKEESLINITVVDENNNKITRLLDVVKILDLKKEVVKKVKRIGYCGKSIDTWADLMNAFYKPVATGYYSDNKYNFYKWDHKNCRLVRQIREGITPGAPNISDYEYMDSKVIVRTDYTGAGLNPQFI